MATFKFELLVEGIDRQEAELVLADFIVAVEYYGGKLGGGYAEVDSAGNYVAGEPNRDTPHTESGTGTRPDES